MYVFSFIILFSSSSLREVRMNGMDWSLGQCSNCVYVRYFENARMSLCAKRTQAYIFNNFAFLIFIIIFLFAIISGFFFLLRSHLLRCRCGLYASRYLCILTCIYAHNTFSHVYSCHFPCFSFFLVYNFTSCCSSSSRLLVCASNLAERTGTHGYVIIFIVIRFVLLLLRLNALFSF